MQPGVITLDRVTGDFLRTTINTALAPLPDAELRDNLRTTFAIHTGVKPDAGQLADAVNGVQFGKRMFRRIEGMYIDNFESFRSDPLFIFCAERSAKPLEGKSYAAAPAENKAVFHLSAFCNTSQVLVTKLVSTLPGHALRRTDGVETLELDGTNPYQIGVVHVVDKMKQTTLLEIGKLWQLPGEAMIAPLDNIHRREPRVGGKPPAYKN